MTDNWATRKMKERMGLADLPPPPPDLTLALLEWLEREYPPRCYNPRHEQLEAHLVYSGKAELAQELRTYFEQAKEPDADVE